MSEVSKVTLCVEILKWWSLIEWQRSGTELRGQLKTRELCIGFLCYAMTFWLHAQCYAGWDMARANATQSAAPAQKCKACKSPSRHQAVMGGEEGVQCRLLCIALQIDRHCNCHWRGECGFHFQIGKLVCIFSETRRQEFSLKLFSILSQLCFLQQQMHLSYDIFSRIYFQFRNLTFLGIRKDLFFPMCDI